MNMMELVHLVSKGAPYGGHSTTATPPFYSELIRPVRQSILRTRQHLLTTQRSDGSWLGHQTTDAGLASQLVLMLAYLGCENTPLAVQAAAFIGQQQLPKGGWSLVPGGPVDLSTSVQAYFALKLAGGESGNCQLQLARDAIRRLGGADGADASTRFFLALLGQVSFDVCPAVFPELLLGDVHDHTFAAMAAIWCHRPVRKIDAERGVRELFIQHTSRWPVSAGGVGRIENHSALLRCLLRLFERHGFTPLRKRALNRVHQQLLPRPAAAPTDEHDFCAHIWRIIALDALGYRDDAPQREACTRKLREMIHVSADLETAWPRLRSAPVHDTMVALESLAASGMAGNHPSIAAAAKWLTDRRSLLASLSGTELAGLMALLDANIDREAVFERALPPALNLRRKRPAGSSNRHRAKRAAIGPAATSIVKRLLQRQNTDGGWADRGAVSTPDATGAVLEALHQHAIYPPIQATHRAIDYLRRVQRPDGSWNSAGGARWIHGTSLALRGLLAAGVPHEDDVVAAGLNWIISYQQPSGGWGELPFSPDDTDSNDFAHGPATASQTAWALLALIAAGRSNSTAVRRGIEFLLETQLDEGNWNEPQFVLRDPLSGHWFHSDLHSAASPLLALSRWAVAATSEQSSPDARFTLRLVGDIAE